MVDGSMVQRQELQTCTSLGVGVDPSPVLGAPLPPPDARKINAGEPKVQGGARPRSRQPKRSRQWMDHLPASACGRPPGGCGNGEAGKAGGQEGRGGSATGSSRGERERGGRRNNGSIDLGNGVRLPIPPFYDDLVKSGGLPSLKAIEIDDDVLKGPITTVTLADLKAATLERQAGMHWACFPAVGLGYNPETVKQLPHFLLDQALAAEGGLRVAPREAERAAKTPARADKVARKRGRPCKDEAQGDGKRRAAGGRKAVAVQNEAVQDSDVEAVHEAAAVLQQLHNATVPAKKSQAVKEKKVTVLDWSEWSDMRLDKITPKQRSVLKKAAQTNPELRDRLEEVEVRKHWAGMVKRDLPRTYRNWQTFCKKQSQDAKKLAEFCRREVRQRVARVSREATKMQGVMKKLAKDMLAYWKKADKEAADARKQEEKAAAEQRKRDEEEREQRRQQQRLNFLLGQTELYSHFMGHKLGCGVDAPPPPPLQAQAGDAEEAEMLAKAQELARAAVESAAERMHKFDDEYRQAQQRAGDESTDPPKGDSLLNPSSMPKTSDVQQPQGFSGELKGYQLRGLQWLVNLYDQGLNGILADEMGLGKTIQAIAFMAHLAEEKNIWGPFLVVAPASTLHNWDNELAQFFPAFRVLPYWGSQQDRKTLRQSFNPRKLYIKSAPFHVAVTSYQILVQDEAHLKRVKWQFMMLDEAQAIKSSSSVRWRTLLSFSCRNRILLTGTPIQNNLAELWALLHFIMPTLFDSMEHFNEWFSKGLEGYAEGSQELNKEQLKRLHTILSPFMLRRVKADVAGEMMAKEEHFVFCELSRRQRILYRAIRENLNLADLFDSDEKKVVNLMNLVIQLRKVCNHPELFEEQSERVPLHFAQIPPPLSPPGFGGLQQVYWSGQRSEVVYKLPKLVFRENMGVQTVYSGLPNGFWNKWVHNRLNVFCPWNVHSSLQECEEGRAMSAFPFSRHIGLSTCELHAYSMADPLQRWMLEAMNCRNGSAAARHWESHWDSPRPPSLPATCRSRRLLIIDLNADSAVLRSPPVAADSVGCGPLVRSCEQRLYSLLNVLRKIRPGFVPPVLAPPPLVICSDRAFAHKQNALESSPWLNRLLFGSSNVRSAPDFAAGAPSALMEMISRCLHEPMHMPMAWALHRAFGACPPMQHYALAKALVDSGKLLRLDVLLRKLKAEGHRVLLFSQMTMMMNILCDYLNFRRYRHLRLDGQSSISDRRDMVQAFQSNPDIFVFLLSTRAGGLGINLTGADTVIFFESDWNPTMDLQAMDRAHRLGQTRNVTVYRLICRGTIEEKILQRAREKKTVQQLVMTGQSNRGDLFAPEEVMSLLLEEGDEPKALRGHNGEQVATIRMEADAMTVGVEGDG
ncbi:unnamed protein product, partial [Ostreobium quekettii]